MHNKICLKFKCKLFIICSRRGAVLGNILQKRLLRCTARLTSLVVTIFSLLRQCFWLVQLNTRVDISYKFLCRIIIKIFYRHCVEHFHSVFTDPLKLVHGPPCGSVDPGLRTPGLVERFNPYLRTALRCRDNNGDWFDHLGLCLLGIQASYHSALKMSRAERLFGKKIQLPSSFFDETTPKPRFDDPALTKSLMNFFSNRTPAPINTEKRCTNFHVDKQLFTRPAVYLRVDRVKKGLANSFTGPFKVLERFDKYFIIETFKGSSKISIDRLKPTYTLDFVNDSKATIKNNNDSFISSRNKSTSNSAATVTKDSRRRPYENNLYFTDTSNKLHSDSFDIDQRDPSFSSYNIPTKTTTRSGRVINLPIRYRS